MEAQIRAGSRETVTALLPCLNGEPFVERAIESILCQTHPLDEIVLFDNASQDGTRKIFEAIAQKDQRIRVYSNAQTAPAWLSHKQALDFCRTKYAALFHADDISRPDRVAMQMEFMAPDVGVVTSFMKTIDKDGDTTGLLQYPVDSAEFVRTMHRRNVVALPAVLLRRTSVEAAGGIRSTTCFDYDLWLRMMETQARIAVVPEALVSYRRHDGQDSAGTQPWLLWCKFNSLLSAAFRRAGRPDPFDADPCHWGEPSVALLEVLIPTSCAFVKRAEVLFRQGSLCFEDHREIRDEALQILVDSGMLDGL